MKLIDKIALRSLLNMIFSFIVTMTKLLKDTSKRK